MATFKVKNWFQNNSPKFWQILGDIGLIATTVSANILLFKNELINIGLTSLQNNPIFDKINVWALTVGASIKFLSKFVGTKSTPEYEAEKKEA